MNSPETPELPIYDDEGAIDLAALFRVLWRHKLVVGGSSVLCGLVALLISFLLTPVYEVSVLVQAVDNESQMDPGNILSRLGSVASIAGIDLGNDSGERTFAVATLDSRHLITKFIADEKILQVLFPDLWDKEKETWLESAGEQTPTLWEGHEFFREKVMDLSEDQATGLITLTIQWPDPVVAVNWANTLIDRVNEHLRQRASSEAEANLRYLNQQLETARLSEMRTSLASMVSAEMQRAMIADGAVEFAFKVVDPAVVPDPDDYAFPNHLLFVLLATVAGLVLSIAWTLGRHIAVEREA